MTPEQLKLELLSTIESENRGIKERLPSLRQISRDYSVSIATARKSISLLKDEGVLVSIHGRGTFLAHSAGVPKRNTRQMIGLGTLGKLELVRSLSNHWLEKGWLLTAYNAIRDSQDPERERKFLETAEQEGFAGVALTPTPIEPLNTALYDRLRQRGMKIALLAPISEETYHSCLFCLDHQHAGYQSVAQMALRGYRNVLYIGTPSEPFFKLRQQAGVQQAANELGLQLLEKTKLPQWEAGADTLQERMRILTQKNLSLVKFFKELPANTAIIADQNDAAEATRRLCLEAGRSVPEDIGICCALTEIHEPYGISGMEFPYQQQINSALEYLTDNNSKATDKICKRFAPKFVERETTRKFT
jgi:DNA-binding LacI/PurR family transcriptional regulator